MIAIAAVLVTVLGLSYMARTYLARQRCANLGMDYVAGKGCIAPPAPPAIILERGLKRT
ncbi:MAG: hypothetical protein KDJ37_02950 [Hyphomicrobiaceae bacterium]|nr:hypothetical protein [Hyphomicrobiaceae bacterium]